METVVRSQTRRHVPRSPTAAAVRRFLRRNADTDRARLLRRFFRTGKGEYGEGDRFLGIPVPIQRQVARKFRALPLAEIRKLLDSPFHECRLTALFILVDRFQRGGEGDRRKVVNLYLEELDRINNWDLVDSSAHKILGAWLEDKDRGILDTLAGSGIWWKQRVAVIATAHFIRQCEFDDTLRIARLLLHHDHDLIHKAVGWMLREVGNRDRARLESFLKLHYRTMPRTMLRYAIERLDEPRRRAYLEGRVPQA